jgi:Zn-dependent membrane protease YugP
MDMFYMSDLTYLLGFVAFGLSLAASGYLRLTFSKYSQIRTMSGLTGAQAAERILKRAGLGNVKIERVAGNLTDHYDPRTKVLRLSDAVYSSPSVAAVGVAAHECGHAVQHSESYGPLKLRSILVPVASIGSTLGYPLALFGLILGVSIPIPGLANGLSLVDIGILLFAMAVLFQLVTLPVEFDASERALRVLGDNGIMGDTELRGGRKVLTAAALTYVAAVASAILSLLRLVLLRGDRRS